MKNLKNFLYLTIATLSLVACGTAQEAAEQESGFIEITQQQFTTADMELGTVESRTFENIFKCSGLIVPMPNGKAIVTAPVNGVIKSIYAYNGQQVGKNQPLLEISGNDIIDRQREYAEASANYDRLNSEYHRVKSLYKERVTAEKDFIAIETEYKAALAMYSALRLKIEAIGLDPAKVENGEFCTSYLVKSPINGVVSNLTVSIGGYVEPQVDILEIINPERLQVRLSVFASDITKVRTGQLVRFKPINSDDVQHATINSIGAAVDNETKTIACFASINSQGVQKPVAYVSVESEVVTSTFSAEAIPKDAILKTENGYYVLALSKQANGIYFFSKNEVKLGRESKGFAEILDSKITGSILTKGSYNISIAD